MGFWFGARLSDDRVLIIPIDFVINNLVSHKQQNSSPLPDFLVLVQAAAMEATLNNTDIGSDPKPPVVYRCKKCRRIVATEEHIVSHERGGGQKCFKWKKRNTDEDVRAAECSSIFVEPMKWMQALEEGCIEDKLQCIGCKARLGSFNWAGMQCNCGAWINPAFQLHKSRMDECRS